MAFDAEGETLLLAWRQAHAQSSVELVLPHLAGRDVSVEQVYPPPGVGASWTTERTGGGLRIGSPDAVASARMFRVSPVVDGWDRRGYRRTCTCPSVPSWHCI